MIKLLIIYSILYLLILYNSTQTDDDLLLVICHVDHHHVGGLIWWTCRRSGTLSKARHSSTTATDGDREVIESYFLCLNSSVGIACKIFI